MYMQTYDPLTHDFLNSVFGPTAATDDSPIRSAFAQRMRQARIEDEAFEFDTANVPKPTKRRITTQEGVVVTYDDAARNTIATERLRNQDGWRIVIETRALREDDIT